MADVSRGLVQKLRSLVGGSPALLEELVMHLENRSPTIPPQPKAAAVPTPIIEKKKSSPPPEPTFTATKAKKKASK